MSLRSVFLLVIFTFAGFHAGDTTESTIGSHAPRSPLTGEIIMSSDFEAGTQSWVARIGNEVVMVSAGEAYSGNHSLVTTSRLHPYDGCSINVSEAMLSGSRYRVSLWARLAQGASAGDLKVSLERRKGLDVTYQTVVSAEPLSSSSWRKFSAVYEPSEDHDELWLYVESSSGTHSFHIDEFRLEKLPPLEIEADLPSLSQSLSPYFRIGAAVSHKQITGAHAQLLKKHFNSITAEDAMKWEIVQPSEGKFTFSAADKLIDHSLEHGMSVRGHTLIWHEQTPGWVFKDDNGMPLAATPENKAKLLGRLESHIRSVLRHFGPKVESWDVVNEALDHRASSGFRANEWLRICGPEYIEKAFLVARQEAPNAKLFINDNETTDPLKRELLKKLVINLRERGIPIDGIGHQLHSDIESPTPEEIKTTVEFFATIPNLDQQITEFDMSVYNNWTQTYQEIPPAVLLRQGYRYKEIFDVLRPLSPHISSFTFWGMADDHTWLSAYPIRRLEAPLPFDEELKAKPAFWGIVDPSRLKVEISGRVLDPAGRAVRGARVSIRSENSEAATVATGSFGHFAFTVDAFTQYQISVQAKRHRFPPRFVSPTGPLSGLEIIGME